MLTNTRFGGALPLVGALLVVWPIRGVRQTCVTPGELATDLAAAQQGEVISLAGIDPLQCPEVQMAETWSGGKLIVSDSPESPGSAGKLYEDGALAETGDTSNRVFLYHANGSDVHRLKFTVLLENQGAVTGTVTVQKRGTAGPTTDYVYGGQVAFQRWLDSTPAAPVAVAAGATIRLDSAFDTVSAAQASLLHGIWDYSFDQPHRITICALEDDDEPLSICPDLPVLPRDTHVRGTFDSADKIYESDTGALVDTSHGIQQIPIAGNTPHDTNAVGLDWTDGRLETLGGNYGVLYRIGFWAQSSDGQELGFLFNPRGGGWGGAVNAMTGLLPGGIFLVPSAGSLADNSKGAVEGRYRLDSPSRVWLQVMPTGGSSFPLRFLSVPYAPGDVPGIKGNGVGGRLDRWK